MSQTPSAAPAIVGHHARQAQAEAQAASLGAHLALDDGTIGTPANHDRAWLGALEHADPDGWVVVLEDDALPVDSFTYHAKRALNNVPSEGAVSFYTGTTRPNPKLVTRAVQRATETGAAWLSCATTLWGVALALPTKHVQPMLHHVATVAMPYDQRLGTYLRHTRLPCYYTNPSLVDHADTPSLIGNHYPKRVAHHTGTRKQWATHVVEI